MYTVMVCSVRKASSHESLHEQEVNGAKKREQEQSRFESVAAERCGRWRILACRQTGSAKGVSYDERWGWRMKEMAGLVRAKRVSRVWHGNG